MQECSCSCSGVIRNPTWLLPPTLVGWLHHLRFCSCWLAGWLLCVCNFFVFRAVLLPSGSIRFFSSSFLFFLIIVSFIPSCCKWCVHRMFHHDSTALTTRASGLRWPATYTGGIHRNYLRTNPVDQSSPLQKLTHTLTIIIICFMHTDRIQKMSGFVPLNAGYTVSVRRTRLNVLVLLTLAIAGESPTCILHEGIHTL